MRRDVPAPDLSASSERRQPLTARWARRLLWLYPRAWRKRYGDEMAVVLARHRITLWTLFDIALGAADAHLHGDLLPGRLESMAHRIRSSEIAIFCAFVIFCTAWLALRTIRDPLAIWLPTTARHPELLYALTILDICGAVATLAILVGGLPLLVSALRQAIAARRWKLLALFAAPIVAAAALVVVTLADIPWSSRSISEPGVAHMLLPVVLQIGLVALLLLAVGGSATAIAAAMGRSELGERLLRFALWPAGIITAALAMGLLAAGALTVLILDEAPQVSMAPPMHSGDLLLMLVAVALAIIALKRGIRASRSGDAAV